MYSERITREHIAAVEGILGRTLRRYSVDDYRDAVASLAEAVDGDGNQTRPLTEAESQFIEDQTLLCTLDFRYWAERNVFVQLDSATGGLGLLSPWGSQRIILEHIAHVEEEMWADYDRQVARGLSDSMIRVKGICVVVHKARQMGATIVSQAILLHRFCFSQHIRLVVASADNTKTGEVFDKMQLMFRYLPWWMKPDITSKTKIAGMQCESLDTTVLLQDAKQESGIAMGGTTHGGHLTELASWPRNITDQLENHFFKSVPYSLVTIVILESLAQGQGNYWHQLVRSSLSGNAGRWHGIFVPWYSEPGKYRLEPPDDWTPSEATMKYAYRVYSTSEQWVGRWDENGEWQGERVTLDRAQLYFYEDARATAEQRGMLAQHLQNYPATPEEGFQSRTQSPFSPTVLDRLLNDTQPPAHVFEWLDRGMRRADLSVNPNDLRGLIRMWERPNAHARYIMGVDASRGLPNWSRRSPQEGDTKTDNCAIEIIRVGEHGEPDVQVCEFLAPITYDAAAPIANYLGRLYHGREEEMCEAIVETYPSPGEPLQEKLWNEFGYYRLYRKANMATYTHVRSFGWEATPRAVRDLWHRTKPHISYCKIIKYQGKELSRVRFIARSAYLVDVEMRNCEEDPNMMTAKADYGFHDDALRATQCALYAAHDWESYGEVPDTITDAPPNGVIPDYQASDLTREEMIESINAKLDPDSYNHNVH